jgi:hypothetical protein
VFVMGFELGLLGVSVMDFKLGLLGVFVMDCEGVALWRGVRELS